MELKRTNSQIINGLRSSTADPSNLAALGIVGAVAELAQEAAQAAPSSSDDSGLLSGSQLIPGQDGNLLGVLGNVTGGDGSSAVSGLIDGTIVPLVEKVGATLSPVLQGITSSLPPTIVQNIIGHNLLNDPTQLVSEALSGPTLLSVEPMVTTLAVPANNTVLSIHALLERTVDVIRSAPVGTLGHAIPSLGEAVGLGHIGDDNAVTDVTNAANDLVSNGDVPAALNDITTAISVVPADLGTFVDNTAGGLLAGSTLPSHLDVSGVLNGIGVTLENPTVASVIQTVTSALDTAGLGDIDISNPVTDAVNDLVRGSGLSSTLSGVGSGVNAIATGPLTDLASVPADLVHGDIGGGIADLTTVVSSIPADVQTLLNNGLGSAGTPGSLGAGLVSDVVQDLGHLPLISATQDGPNGNLLSAILDPNATQGHAIIDLGLAGNNPNADSNHLVDADVGPANGSNGGMLNVLATPDSIQHGALDANVLDLSPGTPELAHADLLTDVFALPSGGIIPSTGTPLSGLTNVVHQVTDVVATPGGDGTGLISDHLLDLTHGLPAIESDSLVPLPTANQGMSGPAPINAVGSTLGTLSLLNPVHDLTDGTVGGDHGGLLDTPVLGGDGMHALLMPQDTHAHDFMLV